MTIPSACLGYILSSLHAACSPICCARCLPCFECIVPHLRQANPRVLSLLYVRSKGAAQEDHCHCITQVDGLSHKHSIVPYHSNSITCILCYKLGILEHCDGWTPILCFYFFPFGTLGAELLNICVFADQTSSYPQNRTSPGSQKDAHVHIHFLVLSIYLILIRTISLIMAISLHKRRNGHAFAMAHLLLKTHASRNASAAKPATNFVPIIIKANEKYLPPNITTHITHCLRMSSMANTGCTPRNPNHHTPQRSLLPVAPRTCPLFILCFSANQQTRKSIEWRPYAVCVPFPWHTGCV